MAQNKSRYVIVGAGLAAASAIEGIREQDRESPILLIGAESHLPYHRPPLTKSLWKGTKSVANTFVHDAEWYRQNNVNLALGRTVEKVDAANREVIDRDGTVYGYEKLLLATGGKPRHLPIPGGDLEGIVYYRTLDDYEKLRHDVGSGVGVLVIGGGFIGSEIAASLSTQGADVTMLYPEQWLCARVFPESLGTAMQQRYRERNIAIISGDQPEQVGYENGKYAVLTREGQRLEADLVVAGIGIEPEQNLARSAGLETNDGIVVNEFLQTSNPDIYAAGDHTCFPAAILGHSIRIEHWDNALSQGTQAGLNMAGDNEPFTYLPYFFSDLFDFGYEAVGETDPRLDVYADWQKENDTGVVYYLKDRKVRGVLACNIFEKMEMARQMIAEKQEISVDQLHGALV